MRAYLQKPEAFHVLYKTRKKGKKGKLPAFYFIACLSKKKKAREASNLSIISHFLVVLVYLLSSTFLALQAVLILCEGRYYTGKWGRGGIRESR